MKIILTIIFNCLVCTSFAQRLIFKDDFKDTHKWIIEMVPTPNSSVYTDHGKLILDTKGGVSVWLNQRLEGNILIEYKRKVLVAGKVNDRLSDLNQFWMAS